MSTTPPSPTPHSKHCTSTASVKLTRRICCTCSLLSLSRSCWSWRRWIFRFCLSRPLYNTLALFLFFLGADDQLQARVPPPVHPWMVISCFVTAFPLVHQVIWYLISVLWESGVVLSTVLDCTIPQSCFHSWSSPPPRRSLPHLLLLPSTLFMFNFFHDIHSMSISV
jgi:hypothetical protein